MPPDSLTKPGCYGSPLCCARNCTICSGCPFVAACEIASEARAADLRSRFGIDASMLTPQGRTAAKVQKKAVIAQEAAKKIVVKKPPLDLFGNIARTQLDRLAEHGIDLMDLGGTFVLPVRNVPEFLRLALQKLEEGPVETPILAEVYREKLAWPELTATSHAEIASRMLMQSGRAERDPRAAGRILLREY